MVYEDFYARLAIDPEGISILEDSGYTDASDVQGLDMALKIPGQFREKTIYDLVKHLSEADSKELNDSGMTVQKGLKHIVEKAETTDDGFVTYSIETDDSGYQMGEPQSIGLDDKVEKYVSSKAYNTSSGPQEAEGIDLLIEPFPAGGKK